MPIDISSSAALVASIQHSLQIVKSLFNVRDGALEREKTAELREKLFTVLGDAMTVQAALASAQEEVAALKDRIVKMENWNTEAARYELKEIVPGRFAYSIKEAQRGAEPAHSICASCYQRGVKSILQAEHQAVGRVELLLCHVCDAEIITRGVRQVDSPRRR